MFHKLETVLMSDEVII